MSITPSNLSDGLDYLCLYLDNNLIILHLLLYRCSLTEIKEIKSKISACKTRVNIRTWKIFCSIEEKRIVRNNFTRETRTIFIIILISSWLFFNETIFVIYIFVRFYRKELPESSNNSGSRPKEIQCTGWIWIKDEHRNQRIQVWSLRQLVFALVQGQVPVFLSRLHSSQGKR